MVKISSWGRLDAAEHNLVSVADGVRHARGLAADKPSLPFGMGRSYGDVCLNPGGDLWRSDELNRFLGAAKSFLGGAEF